MSLLEVEQSRAPTLTALTVVKIDKDGNQQPEEQPLQNAAPSHANRVVMYMQVQWMDLRNMPPHKRAYMMIQSADEVSKQQQLLKWTLRGA